LSSNSSPLDENQFESKGRSAGIAAKADLQAAHGNGALTMTDLIPDTTTETLRFGFGDTSLGIIVVAESARGVAALFIGDDRAKLSRDLKQAYPEAELIPDQTGLEQTIAKASALIDTPHVATDMALDLRGSPIELAVWKALQAIPPGETRSYGVIAKTLPMSATAQDVGAACAANRIAVAVPCHRVVKADGSISGYRWGVQRKRRLINIEGVA
jgi:AraC family transcriptional regulator of adaptative response/methylated-DNA-[protein]-cysteine methyltransferase